MKTYEEHVEEMKSIYANKCMCCKEGEQTHKFALYGVIFDCCATCFAYEVMKEKMFRNHPLKMSRYEYIDSPLTFYDCYDCEDSKKKIFFLVEGQERKCPLCSSSEILELTYINFKTERGI